MTVEERSNEDCSKPVPKADFWFPLSCMFGFCISVGLNILILYIYSANYSFEAHNGTTQSTSHSIPLAPHSYGTPAAGAIAFLLFIAPGTICLVLSLILRRILHLRGWQFALVWVVLYPAVIGAIYLCCKKS